MLTPIDQPLDKLEDLSKSDMYVLNVLLTLSANRKFAPKRKYER